MEVSTVTMYIFVIAIECVQRVHHVCSTSLLRLFNEFSTQRVRRLCLTSSPSVRNKLTVIAWFAIRFLKSTHCCNLLAAHPWHAQCKPVSNSLQARSQITSLEARSQIVSEIRSKRSKLWTLCL